ncbi:MAG TPA: 30S ribosomal protein S5 [Patescibacteria group bacterium]|nr:30S ribosomal protein S5 [Patescibacteria group bacterium]
MEPNKGQQRDNKQSLGAGAPRGGNQRYGGGRGGQRSNQPRPQEPSEFYEKVVQVNRVSKKTKGGDKRSLSVLVVVGDRKGKVGVGLGKAADVQSAVRKATTYAKKHMITVPLKDGRTILHQVNVKLGAAFIMLKPAPKGTGVIAGGPVRVVVEAAGIHDVVSKILGTNNKASNVYATLHALKEITNSKYAQSESKKEAREAKDLKEPTAEQKPEKAEEAVKKEKKKDEAK